MAPLRPRYGDARPRAPRCPPEASVSLFSSVLRSVLSEALRAAAQRHKTHRLPQPAASFNPASMRSRTAPRTTITAARPHRTLQSHKVGSLGGFARLLEVVGC